MKRKTHMQIIMDHVLCAVAFEYDKVSALKLVIVSQDMESVKVTADFISGDKHYQLCGIYYQSDGEFDFETHEQMSMLGTHVGVALDEFEKEW